MLLGEPSTPQSNNNLQHLVIVDDLCVPQVGNYQPTPEGGKFGFQMLVTNLLRGQSLIQLKWL